MYEAIEITRGPTQTWTDADDALSLLQRCRGGRPRLPPYLDYLLPTI